MPKGILVLLKPDGTEERIPMRAPDHILLRYYVGGYIEKVRVRYAGRVRNAYCDENGVNKRLSHNAAASAILARPFTGLTIVGPLVIWLVNGFPEAKPS
jgi:hypothetical protein